VNRFLACLLACWFPAFSADFALLQIKVVEGEGMVYAPGSRATRGITIEITDETGRPLPGVSVSFQLPGEGASGEFMNGNRTEIATTQANGRATAWGMHWNKVPGTVTMRITAAKDGVRAGLVSTQYLDAAARAPSGVVGHRGLSKTLLVALVVVAGAAGAGLAAGSMGGSKTSAATPTQTLSIGIPTIIIGAP
jgi:hypothetical protein